MMKLESLSFPYKILFLLAVLSFVGVAALGAAERTVSPECKAAVSLLNLAGADVDSAIAALKKKMAKTDQALETHRRAMESLHEAAVSGEPALPEDRLNRAEAALKQAQEKEHATQNSLDKPLQLYRKQFKVLETRCRSLR